MSKGHQRRRNLVPLRQVNEEYDRIFKHGKEAAQEASPQAAGKEKLSPAEAEALASDAEAHARRLEE